MSSSRNMTNFHLNNIMSGLNELREHEVLCDVVLQVEKVGIPAHRAVLASFSPYFRMMFTSGLQECQQREVQIRGVDGEALQELVSYAYTASLNINDDNVENLLSAANLLELPAVRQFCSDYLVKHLHPSNCVGFAVIAASYRCDDLLKSSKKFICDHFDAVFVEEEFRSLSQENLVKFLSDDDLGVVNREDTVVDAVQVWISEDPVDRKYLLDEILLECCRFKFASMHLLQELQANVDLIKCANLIKKVVAFKETEDIKQGLELSEIFHPRQAADALCVVGGQNSRFPSLDFVEELSNENQWSFVTPLPECRHKTSAICLNQELYVLGGRVSHVQISGLVNHDDSSEVLKLDLTKRTSTGNNWVSVAPMQENRSSFGVVVYNGFIYAVGGFNGEDYLSCTERYCPLTDSWELLPACMSVSRSCFGCCFLDGAVYAVGGYGPPCLNSAERYEFELGKWEAIAAMCEKRINPGAAAAHGRLYVAGGHNGVAYLRSVECFSPRQNQWTKVSSMLHPRTGLKLANVREEIYAVGGYSGIDYLKTVEKYDPIQDSWSHAHNMITEKSSFALATLPKGSDRVLRASQFEVLFHGEI